MSSAVASSPLSRGCYVRAGTRQMQSPLLETDTALTEDSGSNHGGGLRCSSQYISRAFSLYQERRVTRNAILAFLEVRSTTSASTTANLASATTFTLLLYLRPDLFIETSALARLYAHSPFTTYNNVIVIS